MATTREAAELHVLAVDDSSVDRRLIERLLRASSYRGTEGEHDHHRLLHAGDDGLRSAEDGQGVVGAERDPRGHRLFRERPQQDQPLPRRRSGRFPPQAAPPGRRFPAP